MSLFPLKFPPGIYRNGTNYQALGRYYDADLMRFYEETIRPFGGWVTVSPTALEGPGRGMVCYRPSDLRRLAGIGTPNKLYVWDDDVISDITPSGFEPGVVDTFYGLGYGVGPYGDGSYGETSGSGATDATTWALQNLGDFLVACASHDKKIYLWQGDINTPADVLANAPTAISILITDERIVVAIGADGNLRAVAWNDPDDATLWASDTDNFAGTQLVQSDGTLVTGVRVRGKNLLFTTTDVHTMEFIGPPYIYDIKRASENCGLVAPLAVQIHDGDAIWMGQKNFFMYSGNQVLPIPCDVHDYVFGDINFDQAAKFSSGHIAAFGEILFFYCSAASTVIDRCVAYNYREKHWNILPSLRRGCWADVGAFRYPLAVGDDALIYQQESGWTNAGAAITSGRFVKSGPIEIGNGDQIIEATQLIPDEVTPGQVRIRFDQKFTPEGTNYPAGPYTIAPYTDVRLTARQVAIQIEATADADFRIGTLRLEASPGGAR